MEINTGDAYPRKKQVRRMPFALRQEVATTQKYAGEWGDKAIKVAVGKPSGVSEETRRFALFLRGLLETELSDEVRQLPAPTHRRPPGSAGSVEIFLYN